MEFYKGWSDYKEEVDAIFHDQKEINDVSFYILHEHIEDMSEYFIYTPSFDSRINASLYLCEMLFNETANNNIIIPVGLSDDKLSIYQKMLKESISIVRENKSLTNYYFN